MRRDARACWVLSRALAAVSFLAVLLAAAPAEAATAVQLGEATLQVVKDGTWDVPPAQAPALDPQAWRRITLPHAVPRSLVPATEDPIDTAWYRLDLPTAAVSAVEPGDLMLYVPRWQTIGQVAVYADGRLAWRSRGDPVWNGFNHPLWIQLEPAPGTQRPSQVLVRVDFRRSAGAALSTAWIGDAQGLGTRRLVRETLQSTLVFVASSTFLVIGLFALLVWVARREAAYGLFFICSAFHFLRSLHFHMGLEPLPVPSDWFGWWTVHSETALAITINVFALRLAGARLPRAETVLIGLAGSAALLGLPPLAVLPETAALSPLLFLGTLLAFIVFCVLTIVATWRSGSRDALVIACWNAVSIPAGVHDWMLQNYRISPEAMYLLPLAAIGLLSLFLGVVVRRYVQALGRSERAQYELEQRLREREAELRDTYDKLRSAEQASILAQERQRLMQDMHDGLGSSLTGALKAVENGLPNDVAGILRQCLDDLRLAIDSLEPAEADLLVLLATLRYRLGTRLEQAGLALEWQVQEVPALPWLDPGHALQILRILQEVLSNAVKHSQARRIRLTTAADGRFVLVRVIDDGIGFDEGAVTAGRGLANVRRRAAVLGGHAQWRRDGGLTVFELSLPIERPLPADVPLAAPA